ncbi:alkaline phosphatase [Brevundimonas sp. AAP58]|nr:alkaline phosphatase [Brevundimonas sp. AAP58]
MVLAGSAPIALAQEPPQAADSYFAEARADLVARLSTRPITGRARNIILFIGDGMGVSTLTAARIHQGQRAGQDGESTWTAMDRLPYSALVRTYAHDAQVSDSAPTATAMVAGVKTRNDIIGLDQTVALNDCIGSRGREVQSIFAVAEAAGLRTGLVSTARITHATPAAAYAHVANRDWENSSELPAEAREAGCVDIARQMVEWPHGDGLDVILGGGRSQFLPTTATDVEDTQARGLRDDGRDLIAEWRARHPQGRYVWNATQFANLGNERPVLGLFERDHMEFEAMRGDDAGGEPSLTEMTLKALDVLEGGDGYVLMVEAGRIDHAHHLGAAGLALEDTVELDRAVAAVMARIDLSDTLVIVTADHSHNFTMAGYPQRGNPILGLVVDVDGDVVEARDGHPYTTLAYANGPGAVNGPRPDPSAADTTALTYQQQALVPLGSASHGGEDVAVRAAGPWAHLFQGTIEQHLIYHVMRHAMTQPEPDAEASTD